MSLVRPPRSHAVWPVRFTSVDEDRSTSSTYDKSADDAIVAQREGVRRLSLEDRLRQNDSMSRFRAEALRSRQKRT